MSWGSGPGCVEAFAAHCNEEEVNARPATGREAEAIDRPAPIRIKERAEAIVVGTNGCEDGTSNSGKARKADCEV